MADIDITAHHPNLRSIRFISLSVDPSQMTGRSTFAGPILRTPLKVDRPRGEFEGFRFVRATGVLLMGWHNSGSGPVNWAERDLLSRSYETRTDDEYGFTLVFPFAWDTVDLIERKRNGDNFQVTLGVEAVLTREDDDLTTGAHGAGVFSMNRADWQDNMLANWEYETHTFLQWGAPQILSPEYKPAAEEYKKAEAAFKKSDWEQTLTSVRNAYDALLSLEKLQLDGQTPSWETRLKAYRQQILSEALGETRASMIEDMIRSQRRFTSAPTKPGSREATREAASLALKTCGTILEYLAEAYAPRM